MAFPRKYQKVPLSVRDGDDDVQLASLRKRVETAADDVQLTQPPQSEEVEAESKQSMTVEKRYSVISTACQQIMRHKRLPLSATLLSDEESISLLDYIVRQVYVEDLPDEPYATSPSAPSMLSGLPALTSAAATSFPPLTSPPHPLHLPTYNLLSATLTHLSRSTASAASSPSSVPGSASSSTDTASPAVSAIASQRVLRVLRQFVADWKYSERKLGLKEPNDEQQQDDDEEVVGMGDWLADAADEDDEGEVETMSMADFLGGPEDEAVGGAEDEDDDKDQDEERGGRDEHRIDVGRAVERKESRPPVGKAAAAKLPDQVDEGYEEGAEDELDEVRLDDLEMDELEGEEDAGLELVLSPSRGTSKPKGLK